MLTRMLGVIGVVCVGLGSGCREARVDGSGGGRPERLTARAPLRAAAGHDVAGEVRFRETDQGVRLEVMAHGLTPGEHGFHIHELGDCSAPDFTSAGGHFTGGVPTHGAPGPDSHAGDLGNVEADENGTVETVIMARYVTLEPGPHSIAGRAIVIHAQPDDLTGQPSGNAGDRVACGVITLDR